jgi:hypothetical protein
MLDGRVDRYVLFWDIGLRLICCQAVAIRKNKLVAEINSSKKSNTFSDR